MTAPEAAGYRHIVTNPCQPLGEIARMLRDELPAGTNRIPTRHLPSWMAALVSLFDKSLRDSRTYLGVVRCYDGSSGVALLGRPLRTTKDALLARARALLERRLV